MENYNLRPCPFCGGNAVFKVNGTISSPSKSAMTFCVQCVKCGARAPSGHVSEISFKLYDDGELKITKDERSYEAAWWNGIIHKTGKDNK